MVNLPIRKETKKIKVDLCEVSVTMDPRTIIITLNMLCKPK